MHNAVKPFPRVPARAGWLALGIGLCAPVWADVGGGVLFEHKDWSLVCDNTRTCRAAGYQSESSGSDPVSLQLVREAGPGKPVHAELTVSSDKPHTGSLRLQVGSWEASRWVGNPAAVPTEQVPVLLQHLLKGERAEVSANGMRWTLSLSGLNAVLLKMDEVQGRVGTPGALIRRGKKPETDVLAPVPALEVVPVKPVAARRSDAALLPAILALVDKTVVDEACPSDMPRDTQLFRLTSGKLLLSIGCMAGAYNTQTLLWLASDRQPHAPRLLDADGEFDPASGEVHASQKIRGLGDCWHVKSWQFDGVGFALTGERVDPLCRGFAGGAWQQPLYVSRLRGQTLPILSKP